MRTYLNAIFLITLCWLFSQAGPASGAQPSVFLPYLSKFRVPDAAPALISPLEGRQVNSLAPVFQWRSNADPAYFSTTFWVSETPDFSAPIYSYGRAFVSSSDGVHLDIQNQDIDVNLKPAVTYYWQAYTTEYPGTAGYPRFYSTIGWFITGAGGTLPAAPQLLTPADGALTTAASLAFTWQAVSGAAYYRLRSQGATHYQADTETPSWTPAPFYNFPAGAYTWKVIARNAYGWSAYPPERSFTVQP